MAHEVERIEAGRDVHADREEIRDPVIEATEEAVVNALLAAETMTGRDGVTAYGLDPERLKAALTRAGAA